MKGSNGHREREIFSKRRPIDPLSSRRYSRQWGKRVLNCLFSKYNGLAAQGAQLGLVDAKQAKIENYVTQKTLDGLFLMIAEQEKAIRKDPVGSATGMVQKVFGLLGK
jgi:hypothetical protein